MTVREFQQLIRAIYFEKDRRRGRDGTFRWLVEETGELARALRRGEKRNLQEEFADVFAWLASLASLERIDLAQAVEKYGRGCPKCHSTPCTCTENRARPTARRRSTTTRGVK